MKKLFKIILITFGLISSVMMIGFLIGFLFDTGPTRDEEITWTPPNEIRGVYLGMTRSDLLFNFEYRCWEPSDGRITFLSKDSSGVRNCDYMGSTGYGPSVYLKNDVVTKLVDSFDEGYTWYNLGGYTVEEIQNRLGEPDILSINKDLSGRVYTYLDHRLSVSFTRNELGVYKIGDLVWSDVRWNRKDMGEMFIRGELVCPSSNCPFSEDGSMKDDYPYETPFDFPL